MAKQTILAELVSSFLSKINSNFTELYTQAPPDADRAFSHTYIKEGDEVATPTLVANTPTKYQLPVTARELVNFEIADIGGGQLALKYIGTRDITVSLHASSSVITSANNVVVKLMMYKNSQPVDWAIISRKIGTGADLGAMALNTSITLSTNNYLDVYVQASTGSTITFSNTNLVINEVHQD